MEMIVSDFDGTILRGTHITDSTIEFINRIKSKNNLFVVATGRSPSSILNAKSKRGLPDFDFAIASNGSIILDKQGHLVKYFPISLKSVINLRQIFDRLRIKDEKTVISTKDGLSDGIEELSKNSKYICKVTIESSENIEYLYSKLLPTGLTIETNGNYIDITEKSVNKFSAIKWLTEHTKFNLENVFVIGDDYNDIDMLSKIKNSFTFVDSPIKVKKAANHILTSFEDLEKYIN